MKLTSGYLDEELKMQDKNSMNLIHGLDTVQCAYYLGSTQVKGIDFDSLTREREGIKESKFKDPKVGTRSKIGEKEHVTWARSTSGAGRF